MAEPRGWEVVFHCPACDQQARIWLAVHVYYLMTGPSLTCGHCGALIAVALTVVFAEAQGLPDIGRWAKAGEFDATQAEAWAKTPKGRVRQLREGR